MPDNNPDLEAKTRLISSLRGHGAHLSVEEATAKFPPELINEKPSNVPYTFWHQLEHIRICQWDILKYVLDPAHVSPSWPAGYWPDQELTAHAETWAKTLADYASDLEELVEFIERADTDVLAPVSHNNGRSVMGSALMIIDHTSYHLGEFVMGRQVFGAWDSALS